METCPKFSVDVLQCYTNCPLSEGPGNLVVWPLGSEGSHQNRGLFLCDKRVGEPLSASIHGINYNGAEVAFSVSFLAGALVLSMGQMFYFELQCFYFSFYIISVQAQKYAVKSQHIFT